MAALEGLALSLHFPTVERARVLYPTWNVEEYTATLELSNGLPAHQPALYMMVTQTNLLDQYSILPAFGLKVLLRSMIKCCQEIAAEHLSVPLRAAHRILVQAVAFRAERYRRYIAMGAE